MKEEISHIDFAFAVHMQGESLNCLLEVLQRRLSSLLEESDLRTPHFFCMQNIYLCFYVIVILFNDLVKAFNVVSFGGGVVGADTST